jgi:leucyl/phenylalanyl-tRNA--protein transferase
MKYINGYPVIETGDDFPDPRLSPGDYPLAIGRRLTPDLMLAGYAKGIFAWSSNPVSWWSPDPRGIFDLEEFRVSKRLARKIRQRPFRVTADHAFTEVVRQCARSEGREDETWITEDFVRSFSALHARGYAHSVECWREDRLAGGLFGVALEGFFSAESMYYRVTDASKIALYYLVETLKISGFRLLDIQMLTPHTQSMGGKWISRKAYLKRLDAALRAEASPLRKQVLIP